MLTMMFKMLHSCNSLYLVMGVTSIKIKKKAAAQTRGWRIYCVFLLQTFDQISPSGIIF